jgi:hypothetical protein
MFFKTSLSILVHLVFLSAATVPIVLYINAKFDPMNTRYAVSNLSSISSIDACVCLCLNNVICSTGTYFGINQTCLLYFAQLSQGQLRVVPTVVNAAVYSGNKSIGGK